MAGTRKKTTASRTPARDQGKTLAQEFDLALADIAGRRHDAILGFLQVYGAATLRGLYLANAGAVIAILAFLSSFTTNGAECRLAAMAAAMKAPVTCFVWGVLAAVGSTALAYANGFFNQVVMPRATNYRDRAIKGKEISDKRGVYFWLGWIALAISWGLAFASVYYFANGATGAIEAIASGQ